MDPLSGALTTINSVANVAKEIAVPQATFPSEILQTARFGESGETYAFSETGLPYDAWWAQLKPMLSDSAQAVYVYDDPRNLPTMKLTGKLSVAPKAPDDPRFTAEVVVPTSAGVFRLDLERHTRTSPYLLYAIKFPAGVK